jgi:hypothetical protein
MKSRAPARGSAVNGTTSQQGRAAVATLVTVRLWDDDVMKKPRPKAKPRANGKATIAMFKELKRAQIADVKVLIKAVPKLIAAQAQALAAHEQRKLDEKIRHSKDRIRFCYFLYTDAAALLGPKPKWLITE